MEDQVMNDPCEINEQTYSDLQLEEYMPDFDHDAQRDAEFAAAEDNYLTEPEDDTDEDYTDEGWEDEDED